MINLPENLTMKQYEDLIIEHYMKKCGMNKTHCASILEISVRKIRYKINRNYRYSPKTKLSKGIPELTLREMAIANEVCNGYSLREIADIICVSEKTVKFHLTNIYRKLGLRGKSDLISHFFKNNLVTIVNPESPIVESVVQSEIILPVGVE